jgi:uncharacterized repeat protein (TIGR02543 family)
MMHARLMQYLLAWLFLLMAGGTAMAQDGGYDPVNPPEPQVLNRIKVVASPADAGYVSGTGQYTAGTKVTIRTSAKSTDYTFCYWKDEKGVIFSEQAEFIHTVEEGNRVFTAVYEYSPESPAEPTLVSKRRIYLTCEPAEACSFNRTSGAKTTVGESVNITAYANQGFVFKGWYQGSNELSTASSFNYTLPDEDVTLRACFEYDPDSPGEPTGNQDDVDNTKVTPGDVNGDGKVNVVDIALVRDHILGNAVETFIENAADLNEDGKINVTDLALIRDIILSN